MVFGLWLHPLVHPTSLPSPGSLTNSHRCEQVAAPLLASCGSHHYSAAEGIAQSYKVTQKHHLSKNRSSPWKEQERNYSNTPKATVLPSAAPAACQHLAALARPQLQQGGGPQHPPPGETPIPHTSEAAPSWGWGSLPLREQRASALRGHTKPPGTDEKPPEASVAGPGVWCRGAWGGHGYKYDRPRQANTPRLPR